MAATFILQVLTANRLTDGEAVWWSAAHGWGETLAAADVAHDPAAAARLEGIGKAAYAANLVVDVNLIDVELADGEIVPLRLREKIRASGPTNRPDLGKQARAGQAQAGLANSATVRAA